MMKRVFTGAVCAAALTFALSIPVFAGQWTNSPYGWWYDNGDGTCMTTGWHWIDGNNDGIAECYYFNESYYCIPWSWTPDGYLLDANGAWSVNGIVQTQVVQTQADQQTQVSAETQETAESQEETETDAIIGEYRGTFTDNKGKTGVDLTVFEEDGELKAEFIFYNLEGQTNAKEGSYLCKVSHKEGDTYEIRYDRWLNQPSGYSMRNWTVTLKNKRLEGNVINNTKYTIRCTRRNK